MKILIDSTGVCIEISVTNYVDDITKDLQQYTTDLPVKPFVLNRMKYMHSKHEIAIRCETEIMKNTAKPENLHSLALVMLIVQAFLAFETTLHLEMCNGSLAVVKSEVITDAAKRRIPE